MKTYIEASKMNITTKVLKVKLLDKFKLRRGQNFQTQFRNALYCPKYAVMLYAVTKFSSHSQKRHQTQLDTNTLKPLLQMQTPLEVLAWKIAL